MSDSLQQQLLAAITTTTATHDLPLDHRHVERLAVELTPVVKAMLATAEAAHEETTPVRYQVTAPALPTADSDGNGETETTQVEGCLCRIGLDVDHDSPAATLAHRLRTSQPDVTATEVSDERTMGLTVRPQSIDCWRWWLHRLNIAVNSVRTEDDRSAVTAKGFLKGVIIHVRGDGVPELLTDTAAARLAGVIAGHPF